MENGVVWKLNEALIDGLPRLQNVIAGSVTGELKLIVSVAPVAPLNRIAPSLASGLDVTEPPTHVPLGVQLGTLKSMVSSSPEYDTLTPPIVPETVPLCDPVVNVFDH
jgi:hypothetical protein